MKIPPDHRFSFWRRALMSLFRDQPPRASEASRLDARSKTMFAHSLAALSSSERGWISFTDYAVMFSLEDIVTGPSEWDVSAQRAAAEFAAAYHCSMLVTDAERRVYFTRAAP
jgi:hypothetical protein